jgi:hypothetical protein
MRLLSEWEIAEAAERRAMIAAAPTETIERDGRPWLLRRLPSAIADAR